MKLRVTYDAGQLESVTRKFRTTIPEAIAKGVYNGLRVFMGEMETRVIQKLSGEVLNVRTGTLKSSIGTQIRVEGGKIIGTLGTIMRSVPYARIHEFGGTVLVPQHIRTSRLGKAYFAGPYTIVMPQRSYLRTTLEEFIPRAKEIITPYIRVEIERAKSQG
ncbi:MAG: hypothetical protein L0Y74_08115 [candidate division Zixibacteria bacterium]|nr:hypothetical protein [candidate division Zixibacteria bacterium]